MLLTSWCLISITKVDTPYFEDEKMDSPCFEEQLSALNRGTRKSTGCEKLLIHCCGDSDTAELIFRTFVSVNQLCIHGAVSTGVKSLLTDFRITFRRVQGNLHRKINRNQWCHLRQCQQRPNHFWPSIQSRESCSADTDGNLQNVQMTFQVIRFSTDAEFMKAATEGQHFTTIHDVEMAKPGCPEPCRECTLPRDDDLLWPKRQIRGKTIGPALEVIVTGHQGRYGIEIRIDSMQNDGCQIWIVISRGMNKYVTEMREEKRRNSNSVEANSTNSTPLQHQASSLSKKATYRSSHDTGSLLLSRVESTGIRTSMLIGCWKPYAERILRHEDHLRIADGAIGLENLRPEYSWADPTVNISDWSTNGWIEHLARGSTKQWLIYCFDFIGNLWSLRKRKSWSYTTI